MKHRFVLHKDGEAGTFSINEYAELDKDMFSQVCSVTYTVDRFQAAIDQGIEAAISEMRTENFYPTAYFSEKILQTAVGMFDDGAQETAEVYCDDAEFLTRSPDEVLRFEKIEDEEEIDEFLEDDFPEGFDGDGKSGGLPDAVSADDDDGDIDDGDD